MQSVNIVFSEANTVSIREEPVAEPQAGQVLCAARASLISTGTELSCLRGVFDPGTNWSEWVQYPFHPGYSMAAQVLAVGPDVTDLAPDDRVAARANHRQFFITTPQQCYRLPDAISDDDATWMFLAVTTQLGVRRAALQLGESVGVVGMGQLGQLVVQYLHVSGAWRVVAIDTVQSRLDLAKAHGATHTLALDVRDARAAVSELSDGRMLDAVIDVTGHPAVLAPATQLVRQLGRVVLLGDSPTPSQQQLGPRVVVDSIAILGMHGTRHPEEASIFSPWSGKEMTALFFDYLQQGRMRVADLITQRCSPREAPRVYADLVRDRSGALGVLFDWSMLG